MSDHDDLIEIKTKLNILMSQFDNHLKHHFRYNILAWTVALGAIVSLAVIVIKVF